MTRPSDGSGASRCGIGLVEGVAIVRGRTTRNARSVHLGRDFRAAAQAFAEAEQAWHRELDAGPALRRHQLVPRRLRDRLNALEAAEAQLGIQHVGCERPAGLFRAPAAGLDVELASAVATLMWAGLVLLDLGRHVEAPWRWHASAEQPTAPGRRRIAVIVTGAPDRRSALDRLIRRAFELADEAAA